MVITMPSIPITVAIGANMIEYPLSFKIFDFVGGFVGEMSV